MKTQIFPYKFSYFKELLCKLTAKNEEAKITTPIPKLIKIDAINAFLCQGIFEVDSYADTEKKLIAISG